MKLSRAAVAALAVPAALLLSAGAASAAATPPGYSPNQAGVTATGDTYASAQAVVVLPQVAPPNGTTSLSVYLADASQTVVLAMTPVNDSGTAYSAALANEDPTPGLAPGYTTGYTDTSPYSYAPGDKIELSETYSPSTGNFGYSVIDLTNDTVPVYSSLFSDTGQSFSQVFAGALFASDVYATPAAWASPSVKTELAGFSHVLFTDTAGGDVTNSSRVVTAAGGVKLGTKLAAASGAGKSFKINLLAAS